MAIELNPRPLISSGTLLGIGMGGFVDGILFPQIFQIHAVLSARLPKSTIANVEINMVWDGLFHAMTWTTTALGLFLLFRAGKRSDVPWSGRILVGSLVFGWGLFNLVEGIIDHHILQVHHVYELAGGVSVWDWLFLASGVVFVVVGWTMIRAGRNERGRGQLAAT
jgi:uncharacterized membrane protein